MDQSSGDDATPAGLDPETYRRLFEESVNGIAVHEIVTDDDGEPVDYRFLTVNGAFEEITGLDAETVEGSLATEVVPGIEETSFVDRYGRVALEGESTQFVEYSEPLGAYYEVSAFSPEHGRFVATFTDVTDRIERQRELELSETLFRNAQDAFFVVDVDRSADEYEYRLERVNPVYEELTGRSNEQVSGERIQNAFTEEDAATIRERYRECVERRATLQYEERLSVPEPGSYWETRIAPVVIDDEVVRIVGATRDVTDRVEYERRIQNQRDGLELLNQVVRHDIRNDLQVIRAYTELVAKRLDGDEREYLEEAVESAEHAIDLTVTAREMADVMLQFDADREPVSLRHVLTGEIEEVRSTHSGVALTVEGTVPDVEVLANDMLDSVFRNVLRNAIQHNDADVPEVVVSASADDDRAEVRVADNGPGIPDDRKEAVFGKGEKGLDSRGTGIGLYLVNTLVENYGGEVRVEDGEADGTAGGPTESDATGSGGAVFVVELPVAR